MATSSRVRRGTRLGRAMAFASALGLASLPHRESRADGVADESELHFQIGAEAYRNADFRGALTHFLHSNRLVPNRNVVFNIARAYEQLRRFADAYRYYVEALDGETNEQVRTDINAAVARIAPNVAVIRVATTPPGATIYINRRDLGSRGLSPRPLAFPEGRYRVIAELDGYEPAQSEIIDARLATDSAVSLTLRRIVGNVRVETEAATEVRIDDERAAVQCTAPCDLELPPGPHTLYLTRPGFHALPRQINVIARQRAVVRATLSPLTGTLVVSADERDALVEVDGRSAEFTPAVIRSVQVGMRHVRVSLRGYTTVERDVEVRAGEETRVTDVRLTPLREVSAASRFSESLDDAPSSVTVISSQELRAFGYPTLVEALRGIRGIAISHDGIYSSAGVRGLGLPNSYGNRLLVLGDGQPLNDDVLGSSYVGYDARADIESIDRIEVVRGAGSVLYGTGAFSGVVNLVTRGRDEPTSAFAGISTFDNIARARAGFHVNMGRNAGVWASVSGARSEGRTVTLDVNDGMGGTQPTTVHNVDGFYATTANGRAWWGPFTAQWFYTTRDQVAPHGAYGTRVLDTRTHLTDSRGMGEIRFEPHLTSSVQLLTRVFGNFYDYQADYAYDPAPSPPNPAPSRETYRGMWFGGEARIVATPVPGLRLSAGGEIQVHPSITLCGERGGLDTPGVGCGHGARPQYLDENSQLTIGAVYALAEWRLSNWFRISAGARGDIYSTFGASGNPRVALIFRPTRNGVLKVLGGRAFRAPSIYELYYNDRGQTQIAAPPTLGPEIIYSGEIEYSHRILEDWTALAAVHTSYVEGIIETTGGGTAEDPLQYVNSSVPVITAGADVEVRREWRQGWMLSANYGYQFAQYAQQPADSCTATIATDGRANPLRVVNAPEHHASLRAVVPIVQGLASGALRLSLESPRRISASDCSLTQSAVIADAVVSGGVQRLGIRYAVGVYNLFDWRYALPVSEGWASNTIAQNGRNFMLNIQYTF